MSSIEKNKPRVFIVRPWHDPRTSLYPPVMDGVEYIDSAVSIVSKELEREFTPVYDTNSFVFGETVLTNVISLMEPCVAVVVFLDGMRPNVVYEMGIAQGLGRKILCLKEKNATVLVRNYYSNPTAVDTLDGGGAKILNPLINICKIFSDVSNVLVMPYDRIDLKNTLEAKVNDSLKKLLGKSLDEAREVSQDATEIMNEGKEESQELVWQEEPTDSEGIISEMYDQRQYEKIIDLYKGTDGFNESKFVALSYLRLSSVSESRDMWLGMLRKYGKIPGVVFHLGLCYYILRDYERAAYYVQIALASERDGKRAKQLMDKIKKKLDSMDERQCDPSVPEVETAEEEKPKE